MIDITSKSEEGFKDIILHIDNFKESKDSFIFVCKGIYKKTFRKTPVGIKLTISKNIKPSIINGKFDTTTVYKSGISISSIGDESNNFISALSNYYEIKTKSNFTNKKIEFTCFALMDKPFDIKKDYVKFKLFFDDTNTFGLYSEIFCNINMKEKFVEFPEKDIEYRENFLKALTLE